MTKHTCTLMHCDSMVRNLLPPMRAEMVLRLVQKQGISQSDAAKLCSDFTLEGKIPEPLRVARLCSRHLAHRESE